MKIITKDDYRFYETPLGHLPSVTGIIRFGKQIEQKNTRFGIPQWKKDLDDLKDNNLQLANWGFEEINPVVQESIDKEKSISDLIRDNSVERGDHLHKDIEDFLVDGYYNSHNKLFALFYSTLKKIKPSQIEISTYHPWGFAGTPDCIGEYEGKITVFDWKNSRKPKKRSYLRDYQLQLGAYSKSIEYTHGIKIGQGYICIGVYPDKYLEFTDPAVTVKPELQIFKLTKRQLDSWAAKFKDTLDLFNDTFGL